MLLIEGSSLAPSTLGVVLLPVDEVWGPSGEVYRSFCGVLGVDAVKEEFAWDLSLNVRN